MYLEHTNGVHAIYSFLSGVLVILWGRRLSTTREMHQFYGWDAIGPRKDQSSQERYERQIKLRKVLPRMLLLATFALGPSVVLTVRELSPDWVDGLIEDGTLIFVIGGTVGFVGGHLSALFLTGDLAHEEVLQIKEWEKEESETWSQR